MIFAFKFLYGCTEFKYGLRYFYRQEECFKSLQCLRSMDVSCLMDGAPSFPRGIISIPFYAKRNFAGVYGVYMPKRQLQEN